MRMRKLILTASCMLITTFALSEKASKTTPLPAELRLPGKKGVCFTLREPKPEAKGTWTENIPKIKAVNAYWNYSWGADLVPVQPKTMEFVPMIWAGRTVDSVKDAMRTKVMPQVKRGNVKRLLGFNEPDGKEQANMTPEQALAAWPELEAAGVPLCSPSAVHADKEWMTKFMDGVKKNEYRVDYIGVHSYGGTSAKHFKEKLRKIYELYDTRPLIITEFACADWNAKKKGKNGHSQASVLAFMKDVLPWMEEQPWIAGYSWFSFRQNQIQGTTSALFDKDGNLTACGRYYKSITKQNPKGDQSIQPDE